MRIFIITSNVTAWMLRACCYLFERHWPEHPSVVVGGYDKPDGLPGYVEWFTVGEFRDYPANKWSDSLIKLLEAYDDEIILFTMDDFWLVRDVANGVVELCAGVLAKFPEIARIDLTDDRLYSGGAFAWGAGVSGGKGVDFIGTPPSTPYQLSFQTGLWRRSALLQYLTPGETPAEAEIRGAHRMTRAGANVLGTRQAPVKYLIAMQHGQLHIDDPGYQAPGTALLPDDRAELKRLGYLTPPKADTA